MTARRRIAAHLSEPTLQRVQRLRHGESPDLRRLVTRSVPRGAPRTVVTDFDAHAARRATSDEVRRALDAHGVPYLAIPAPHGHVRQLAVAVESRAAALAAFQRELAGYTLRVASGASRDTAIVLRIHPTLVTPDGALLGGDELGCEVAFWTPTDSDRASLDGGHHAAGTYLAPRPNGALPFVSRPDWERAASSASHWVCDPVLPSIFEITEPVDVVYTWVDGSDPGWQARRGAYDPSGEVHSSAANAARFVSRDELRYSLRSIAMFARWVRRIHIVTDQQCPDWLDVDHPQIRLVDHRDIFADPSVLPVFNSHAIEAQLHRIDGLAERYLYFNDDVFLGRPVEPESFFHAHGPAKFFLSTALLDVTGPKPSDLPAMRSAKNNRALLERDFGVTVHHKMQHGVHPQLRSVLQELEARYPDAFARTAAARFRSPDDLAVASGLGHYYAAVTGRATPGRVDFLFQDLARPALARTLDTIMRRRPEVYCLNDLGLYGEPAVTDLLARFLAAYYPLPSPYERVTNR